MAPVPGPYVVAYLAAISPDLLELARSQLPDDFELRTLEVDTPEARVALCRDADFIFTAVGRVTEAMMTASPRLKLIQHQGVGYDNVDVEAARRHGIPVCVTVEGSTVGVAEHVVLLILALYKRLIDSHLGMVQGRWLQWALRTTSFELQGKTVGIVGLGRIGTIVAQRVGAFGTRLLYWDLRRQSPELERELGVAYTPLDQLLEEADVVTLHVPLTTDTRGLIAAPQLQRMKRSAILINCARGGVADEQGLYEALRDGVIAGAGVDVWVDEPPRPGHPLLTLPNVVCTPHVAAGSADAYVKKLRFVFSNMRRVIEGQEPLERVA